MKGRIAAAVLLAASAALVACSPSSKKAVSTLTPPTGAQEGKPGPKVWTKDVLSKVYHVDKKYKSMKGPDSMQEVTLLDGEPELLWITGYKAVMMNGEGSKPISQEFMCHSNLDFDPYTYWENFGSNASMSGRLFTLSQGQQDVELPQGFGIPIMSNETLDLATQVLNLNLESPNIEVRHKVTIKFVRDRELLQPMTPLFQAAVQGFKSLEGKPAHYGVPMSMAEDEEHGPGCSVGMPAMSGDADKDRFDQKFTGHWVVKPGREVNRSLATHFLQMQFDTTIHYIAVHLHPFAESIELYDLTDKKTVWKAKTRQTEGKIGLAHVDSFSSAEGLLLYKDHDYEVVSVYNNTSSEEQDSMAVMFLYVNDRNFERPDPAKVAERKKIRAERDKAKKPADQHEQPSKGM
jgi:hypothetical protein